MKKLTIFWMIIIACYFASGQDTIPRHHWSIEGGIGVLFPLRNYSKTISYEEYGDFVYGKYHVTPYLTISNYTFNTYYSYTFNSNKKTTWGLNVNLGYQHHKTKTKEEGEEQASWGGYFKGQKIFISGYDHIFLGPSLLCNFRIGKRFCITNEFSTGFYLMLYEKIKLERNGVIWSGQTVSNTSLDKFRMDGGGFISSYRAGIRYLFHKHFSLSSRFEFPLYIYSTTIQHTYWIKPPMATTYLTSINNICLLNFYISFEYNIL